MASYINTKPFGYEILFATLITIHFDKTFFRNACPTLASKRSEQEWVVYKNDAGTVEVHAWDLLKGRAGVFTSITAKGSRINWGASYEWRENLHSGSYSGTMASSSVSGVIINPLTGSDLFTVENSKNWGYPEIFP